MAPKLINGYTFILRTLRLYRAKIPFYILSYQRIIPDARLRGYDTIHSMNILLKFNIQILRSYKLWLVLFILCALIQFFELHALLRFDRPLIEQGQWWRLISGHFTHLGWSHFWLNMAGMGLVAVFFSAYQSDRYWAAAIIFISFFCSVGLMLDHQLDRYVGFSGVLHGLFILGGRLEMQRYKLSGMVLLAVIVGKLIWEQMYGALPGSESMTGGRVAVNAHLYGALAGGFFIFIMRYVPDRWVKYNC